LPCFALPFRYSAVLAVPYVPATAAYTTSGTSLALFLLSPPSFHCRSLPCPPCRFWSGLLLVLQILIVLAHTHLTLDTQVTSHPKFLPPPPSPSPSRLVSSSSCLQPETPSSTSDALPPPTRPWSLESSRVVVLPINATLTSTPSSLDASCTQAADTGLSLPSFFHLFSPRPHSATH
jgi:hypothetical protein